MSLDRVRKYTRCFFSCDMCIPMYEALEELAIVISFLDSMVILFKRHQTNKDHAELRRARVTRDGTDRKHLRGWLTMLSQLGHTSTER